MTVEVDTTRETTALSQQIARLRPHEDLVDRAAFDAIRKALLGRTAAPLQVGRYVVLERIGSGGMGTVFSAWDRELDRRVAVKVLHRAASAKADAALAREARSLARLADPNIVTIYDVGRDHALDQARAGPWLAMEYVDGVDLRRWLAAAERSLRERLDVLGQAALGLRAAHAIGVVHCDIKPENILVDAGGRVRLVDFGLARERADRGGGGTPGYLAPEVRAGTSVDASSDLWSLAVVAHEALVGRRPGAGDRPEGAIGPRPRGVSRAMWRVILRGLDEDPRRRPDASEFARAAASARERQPVRAAWILAAVLGLGVLALDRYDDAASRCPEPAHVVHFDAAARSTLTDRFAASGPAGVDTWSRVEGRLAAFADAWSRERARACGLAIVAARDRRLACLDARAAAFEVLVQRISVADDSTLDRALQGAAELDDPTQCDEVRDGSPLTGQAAAALASARVLQGLGDYTAALDQADLAVAVAGREAQPEVLAAALVRRGSLRSQVGRDPEAVADLAEGYWSASALGRDDLAVVAGIRLMRVIGQRLDDPDGAERWALPVRAAIARAGDRPGDRLLEHIELAILAELNDRYDEVRRHAELAALLARDESLDPALRGRAHGLFAHALGQDRDFLGAVEHHEMAVELAERVAGPQHADVAVARAGLAGTLGDLGQETEAIAEYGRAIEILERRRGAPPAQLAVVLGNCGHLLRQAGRIDEAERRITAALDAYARMGRGADHPDVVFARIDAALIAGDRGDVDAARDRLLELRSELAPDDGQRWVVEDAIGRVALAHGDFAEAGRAFAAALAHPEVAGASDGLLGDVLTGLGEAEIGAGDIGSGLATLERAWALRAAVKAGPLEDGRTGFALARARWASGERARGLALAHTARATAAAGQNHGARVLVETIDAWLRAR